MADKQLVGLERTTPYLALGGKIKPTEMDVLWQYCIIKPSNSNSAIVNTANGTALAGTVTLAYPDYPRSLSFTFTEASGTAAIATATISGKDQFGSVITEELVCTNLGTSTTYGTKVFAYVGTVTLAGSDRASGDAHQIGYSDADGTALFGLPAKIGTASDVKRVTWLDNATSKPGTVTVNTTLHAVKVATGTVSPQDDFIILYKPDYRVNDNEASKIDSATYIS